jgi:hypothetical protein
MPASAFSGTAPRPLHRNAADSSARFHFKKDSETAMRFPCLTLLFVALLVAGCARKEERAASAPAAAQEAGAAAANPARYMAYEHHLWLDAREDKVATLHETALAACRRAVAEQCVVLESSLNTGRHASARLKFRAKPAGIQGIIKMLGQSGQVISQSTSAEDLAGPIEDSAKKLAMLRDYRKKLEVLQDRASSDIESLIKVNKELADVQGQIEALSGESAHLRQRVDTQLLNVIIEPMNRKSFWQPVSLAFADFGTNLSQALAAAITALAYLIPWGITVLVLGWGGRTLWRRIRRSKADA